jgi:hypothetical protein
MFVLIIQLIPVLNGKISQLQQELHLAIQKSHFNLLKLFDLMCKDALQQEMDEFLRIQQPDPQDSHLKCNCVASCITKLQKISDLSEVIEKQQHVIDSERETHAATILSLQKKVDALQFEALQGQSQKQGL